MLQDLLSVDIYVQRSLRSYPTASEWSRPGRGSWTIAFALQASKVRSLGACTKHDSDSRAATRVFWGGQS